MGRSIFLTSTILALCPPAAWASPSPAAHPDPVAALALYLALILLTAKLGGALFTRLNLPPLLAELGAGMLFGNLAWLHMDFFTPMKTEPTLDMLSRLGIVLLLFQVGLETTVGQMLKVGWASFGVGTLGIVAPFFLGWGVGMVFLPGSSGYVHAFLGATLCATSIGITARVFKDMGRSRDTEARVVLGAAVVDDVLALILLAILAGIIVQEEEGTAFTLAGAGWILAKAVAFLGGALALGVALAPRIFSLAARLKAKGVLLVLGLSLCFLLSFLAGTIGLAPIIGAFTAGLILEPSHYRDFVKRGEADLETLIQPLSDFLVPIFFFMVGFHTDLRAFLHPQSLALAGALTLSAVAGKQVCGLAVPGKGVNRLALGLGMVPRGEVTLIMANVGMDLNVGGDVIVSASTYSAIVIMVVLTTLLTPPALKWSLERGAR